MVLGLFSSLTIQMAQKRLKKKVQFPLFYWSSSSTYFGEIYGAYRTQNIIKATQNPGERIKTMSKIKMGIYLRF
ncbi:MAG: hypothetical protein Ct9H90mP20_5020 [Candidatus Neomarinimicrobiota bacterium]|nr:MAG: hypothetical protein Ct9H90mP20_5020 [Candidatus Neomarinimicrobiota bacterium]